MSQRNRVQVDYNPGQTSLEGAVGASAGNYQVSVAPTPKTNAALQFASVINQLPNVAGQATNYASKIAQDEVSQMTDDEILKELSGGDDETFSILKYNKTFNYELVQRKYLMEQQNIANRYDQLATDLGNNPDTGDISTSVSNLEATLFNELESGLTNDLQREAHRALFAAKVAPLKAQAFSKYKDLKTQATTMIIKSNVMQELFADSSPANAQRALRSLSEQLGQLPGMTNKQKMLELMMFSKAYVDQLLFDGRFDEAERAIGLFESYEIYKGAELGGISENRSKFVGMLGQIRRLKDAVEEGEEETFTKKVAAVKSLSSDLMNRLHDGQELDSYEKTALASLLNKLKPTISLEEIKGYVDRLESVKEKNFELRNIVQQVGTTGLNTSGIAGDTTARLYQAVAGHLADTQSKLIQLHPAKFTGIDEAELKTELPRFRQKFRNDSNMSPRQAMSDLGYPGVKIPQEVLDVYNEERSGDWVKETATYRNLKTNIQANVRTKVAEVSGRRENQNYKNQGNEFANSLFESLSNQTLFMARQFKDDKNPEDKISKWVDEQIEDEVRIFGSLLKAPSVFSSFMDQQSAMPGSIEDYDGPKGLSDYEKGTKAEFIENLIPEGKDIWKQKGYEHLALFAGVSDEKFKKAQETTKPEVLNAIRNPEYLKSKYKFMRENNADEALKATMLLYGYLQFDPKAAEDLENTSLTFFDVKLFPNESALNAKTAEWANALAQRNSLQQLEEQEQERVLKAIDEMTSFGLTTQETIEDFWDTQNALF